MILDKISGDVQISGDFQKKSFSIQANAKSFEIFTSKIYTYKARAIIRELSCNAYDSHVEAGKKNVPFDVHLPTTLEPWFSIRDYGTGISHEQMLTLYTEFFTSTRTGSNDFVGALGIGRVSPFCLVDSFTIESYYNGTLRSYSCYKDENGEPQLSPLTQEETLDPNGVRVSLCLDGRDREFKEEAKKVYLYFETLPNINSTEVVNDISAAKQKYTLSNDNFSFTGELGRPVAVMGNVAYEIPYAHCRDITCTGFVRFNIGELSFDAGRESLSLDDKTIKVLADKLSQIKAEAFALIKESVDKEPTAFKKAKKAVDLNPVTYRIGSSSILNCYNLPESSTDIRYFERVGRKMRKSLTNVLPMSFKARYFRNSKGFGVRIREHLMQHGGYIVVLDDEQIAETKIDLDALEDLNTLPKVVRESSGSVKDKTSGCYVYHSSYYIKSSWSEPNDDLETTEKVYVNLDRLYPDMSQSFINSIIGHFNKMGVDIKLYGLNSKFKKSRVFTRGSWIHLNEFVKREISNKHKDLIRDHYFEDLMDGLSKIVSEDIVEWEKIKRPNDDFISSIRQIIPLEQDNTIIEFKKKFFSKYPMMEFVSLSDDKCLDKIAAYIGGTLK